MVDVNIILERGLCVLSDMGLYPGMIFVNGHMYTYIIFALKINLN